MGESLLEVENLEKSFSARRSFFSRERGSIKAVSGVSFTLQQGETLGIVGESGCGKSTLGRTIMGLYPPTAGRVVLQGQDLSRLSPAAMRNMRRNFQMIFQDPYASLNPRMNVYNIIAEPLHTHGVTQNRRELSLRIKELMDRVGLPLAMARRYPHEFSGGQRQRIAIARALAIKPRLLICDEPVSALDVSIQAQIINLLLELQKDLGLSYLFISHDLGVVRHISHRVMVMYLGKAVEYGETADIFAAPSHPYTQALLSAVPLPDPRMERTRTRVILRGELPSPLNPPTGCLFQTRCPFAFGACRAAFPEFSSVAKESHQVACYLRQE
jgi:oligopeptide transport system ATP-binding protein